MSRFIQLRGVLLIILDGRSEVIVRPSLSGGILAMQSVNQSPHSVTLATVSDRARRSLKGELHKNTSAVADVVVRLVFSRNGSRYLRTDKTKPNRVSIVNTSHSSYRYKKALGSGIPRAKARIEASCTGERMGVSLQPPVPPLAHLFSEQVRHYGNAAITCVVQARKSKSSLERAQ